MSNKKISQLNAQTAAATTNADVMPIVSSTGPTTNKILASELKILFTPAPYYYTVLAGDISNGFITLPSIPLVPTSVLLDVIGSGSQRYGSSFDFTVAGNILTFGTRLSGTLVAGQEIRAVILA